MLLFGVAIDDRRERERAARRRLIVSTARSVAEAEGWDAVTTRRLSTEIEYSQPVLYGHFPQGLAQIVTAVALVGFEELAAELSHAALGERTDAERVRALVTAYLDFAARNPATYDAMFLLPLVVPFAQDDTPAVMQAGFAAIVDTLERLRRLPAAPQTAAEMLWGAMHGLASLHRAGRLSAASDERVEALVRLFAP